MLLKQKPNKQFLFNTFNKENRDFISTVYTQYKIMVYINIFKLAKNN